jgi:hypothetical protein
MIINKVLITLSLVVVSPANAFAPNFSVKKSVLTTHRMSAISDAQALLAKAKALRQQAEADEHVLHSTLIEKKQCQDTETDTVIRDLFPLNEDGADVEVLAKRMEELKLSTSMYERVIERLHEREIAAKGVDHVEPSHHNEQVKFVRVSNPHEEELSRVQGLTQRLIDAAEILDEEYLKNEKSIHHHTDDTHWSKGKLSKVLKEKAHFLGREHEAQFQKRVQDYWEAAKKKP